MTAMGVGERTAGIAWREATSACTRARSRNGAAGPTRGPTAWTTPVVSAPTKPSGLPMAMAEFPGANLRRISGGRGGKIRGADAEFG